MITNLNLLALVFLNVASAAGAQLLQPDSVHRTPAAERPVNDLWCYKCHTMDGADRCADPRGNDTSLQHKCKDEKRMCMVKRFSYTTSNENSTSTLKMWSLERNCTKHCEPGCIIIGERTKLYACTSCCETSLCNNGTGRGGRHSQNLNLIASLFAILFTRARAQDEATNSTFFHLILSFSTSIAFTQNINWIFSVL